MVLKTVLPATLVTYVGRRERPLQQSHLVRECHTNTEIGKHMTRNNLGADSPDGKSEFLDEPSSIANGVALERYGRLVATGEVPFDLTLSEPDLRALAEIVRRERRSQLIRFLARLIAQSLRHPSHNP